MTGACQGYHKLLEELLLYSSQRVTENSIQKMSHIKLKYAIILRAMQDLYANNKSNKLSAQEYFDSNTFIDHCKFVSIDPDLMLYIVNNPNKIISLENRRTK